MTWKTVLPKMVDVSQTRNSGDRIIKLSWIESRLGNVCNHTPTSRDCNLLVSPHSVNQRAASGPCLFKGELNGLENLVILHQAISYYFSVHHSAWLSLSKHSSPIRQSRLLLFWRFKGDEWRCSHISSVPSGHYFAHLPDTAEELKALVSHSVN